jgi:hypothetical protein
MQWLKTATLPKQADHAVHIARLAFILMARCPQWARDSDEWLELVNDLILLAESLLVAPFADKVPSVIAELLRCLLCATGDLKTYSPQTGRTQGRLEQEDVERVYQQVCALSGRILKDPASSDDLRHSAVEVCVNAPAGYAGLLVGATRAAGGAVAPVMQSGGTIFPAGGATATHIIERHWDPDQPGQETVKLWSRDDDTAIEGGNVAISDSSDVDSRGGIDGDAAAEDDGEYDKDVITALVCELDAQCRSGDGALTPYTGAVLAVLCGVAQDVAQARRQLKNMLLPRQWDRRRPPEEGDSLRARLTRYFCGEGAGISPSERCPDISRPLPSFPLVL